MGSHLWSVVLLALGLMMVSGTMGAAPRKPVDVQFGRNYAPTWAFDHIKYFNGGSEEIQLSLDKYTGTGFQSKGSLADIKPALLSALEAEYEKNPFEGASAVPKKTIKVLEFTSSLSGGGLDSLPREDISGKISPMLLKGFESTDWKVRLESIVSFKEQVEGIQDLDRSAEVLIRLLCAVPGWSEKNVQVQQQVVDVITHIAASASKFPKKKCVVLCLLGISERVADIKTRAHAMKCLTTFSEAVGPGFIFERLFKILKEHQNPKVLSEGILWMVSADEDFGVSHLKLKDLIDFCKDTGLQSSAAGTRNATIKLIGALHKFVGPVGTSSVQTSSGNISSVEASEGSFTRRSAASMLSGKKHVQAAPASKKGGAVKSEWRSGSVGGTQRNSKISTRLSTGGSVGSAKSTPSTTTAPIEPDTQPRP